MQVEGGPCEMRAAFRCACPEDEARCKRRVRPAGGYSADLIMRWVVLPACRFRLATRNTSACER